MLEPISELCVAVLVIFATMEHRMPRFGNSACQGEHCLRAAKEAWEHKLNISTPF
jgi:hypothetical protein